MRASNTIFPADIANSTVENHLQHYRRHYRGLYLSILGLLLLSFILLFIVRVDISVVSGGIVRTEQERTEIRSLVAGTVDSISIRENTRVRAGDILLKMVAGSVEEKNLALNTQMRELVMQQSDLEKLARGSIADLQSRLYQKEAMLYRQKKQEISIKVDAALKSFNRFRKLHAEKIISDAEFEKYEFEYRTIVNQADLVTTEHISKWQTDLTSLNQQLEDLGSRKALYSEEKEQYLIKAATTGFVQQLRGIQKGSYLQPGDLIGEITPDSGLIVEAYVLPKDIGYINNNSLVRLQVDAFDYNVWGMAEGRVTSVSKDVYMENNTPMFKVRCMLDQRFLELKNGYRGMIKKGMTVQARFVVTERTLFQLLYDKADDWLNPNIVRNEYR